MLGLEISNLVEIFSKDKRRLSFDVIIYGHLIATISAKCEGHRLLWHEATIEGFDDFTPKDRYLIENKVHGQGSPKARKYSLH